MRIFFSGDISASGDTAKDFIGADLIKIIQGCDYGVCNLEGPYVAEASLKKISKAGPYLYQGQGVINYLVNSGFGVFCLANNHALDYGKGGLHNSISAIQEVNAKFLGASLHGDSRKRYEPLILEKDGLRVAIFNACESQNGVDSNGEEALLNWLVSPHLRNAILSVKNNVDWCVLVAHAGLENVNFPIVQWVNIYEGLCDIGVDVIIGHHPHVPQGIAKYKSSYIFYSLGNFFIDQLHYQSKSDDSFSVVLNLSEGDLSYEIIYHKKCNGKLQMVRKEEVDFDLYELNEYLLDRKKILESSKKISNEIFEIYLKRYLFHSVHGSSIKRRVYNLIFRPKYIENRELLEHLFKVETNRFIITTALTQHD